MNIFKAILFMTPILVVSSHVKGEVTAYGLGAEINDYLTIYLPIKSENYLIEPSISFNTRDNSSINSAESNENDYEEVKIGVGIYKIKTITNSTNLYYGMRLGYVTQESNYSSVNTLFENKTESKSQGYFVAPTLGIEHNLSKIISIGIDASFLHSNTDGKRTDSTITSSVTSNTKNTESITKAVVVMRYYF